MWLRFGSRGKERGRRAIGKWVQGAIYGNLRQDWNKRRIGLSCHSQVDLRKRDAFSQRGTGSIAYPGIRHIHPSSCHTDSSIFSHLHLRSPFLIPFFSCVIPDLHTVLPESWRRGPRRTRTRTLKNSTCRITCNVNSNRRDHRASIRAA